VVDEVTDVVVVVDELVEEVLTVDEEVLVVDDVDDDDVEVVVVGTRVVLEVDDVEVVVVGADVVLEVDDVDEEVEAPTSVTLMTFDGPLSNGAAGSAAWLSATMATVSVSVCPAAGSTTENVSAQGVVAQTTDAGWLSTWVQTSDAETKLS
jgi:hypothetical protein